jgi:hypothetical protein
MGRDAHSKTLREIRKRAKIREVLECAQSSAAFPTLSRPYRQREFPGWLDSIFSCGLRKRCFMPRLVRYFTLVIPVWFLSVSGSYET